jgi:L-glyceraldehyde 3-phosphate reductase
MLTDRYLSGIPEDSRVSKQHGFLQKSQLTPEKLNKVRKLNKIASERNQSLAQMAIAWLLKDKRVTSVLIGASSVNQLNNDLGALKNLLFDETELRQIELTLND